MKRTFDELRKNIIDKCFEEEDSLKRIINIVSKYKNEMKNDYQKLLIEIERINNSLSNVTDLVDILYKKSIRDPIELNSRTYLNDNIELLSHEQNLAFIIGDIDNFKKYNDTHGHLQGDIALKCVANKLNDIVKSEVKKEEIPFLARYGGEELCVFIKNFERDIDSLENLANKIREGIENMEIKKIDEINFEDDSYKRITITIAAGIRKKNEPIEVFMYEVDKLLASKNGKGKNRVYVRK